jgi:amidophosphoribosyltransferase
MLIKRRGLGLACSLKFNSNEEREKFMCAIIGIISRNRDVIEDGLILLGAENHRGEQACGAVSFDGQKIHPYYGEGKVPEVFGQRDRKVWSKLVGSVCVMHSLYSTVGRKSDAKQPKTQQPILFKFHGKVGAISHNGNLVRLEGLRRQVKRNGYNKFKSAVSDTEVIAALISTSKKINFVDALVDVLKKIEGKGSFSLVVMYDGKIYGIRDQNGNRPLCIIKKNGKNGDADSYIFASETCVFTSLEATRVIRSVEAGELVILGPDGIERSIAWASSVKPALCVNELIYFAHPASRVCAGCSVYKFRVQAGIMSAKKHPAEADVVVAIPDSGRGFADGFAKGSGIVNLQGLIKNPNAGRTFLQPRHVSRAALQRAKLQALPDVMEGKSVCLGEDSVFRGSVGRMVVRMCREHGRAVRVHKRIGSPPILHRCHLGIDIPTSKELVATGRTIEQIRDFMNVDSIEYLTIAELRQVLRELGLNPDHFCMGCYTGEYPVPPPIEEV